jgi:L,D-transpeptidase YcbB
MVGHGRNDMSFISRAVRVASALPLLALATIGCHSPGAQPETERPVDEPPALVEPTSADPDVASAVSAVLEQMRHPWLRWPELEDVSIALGTLYGDEPDRLLWFAGERPYPALEGAVAALATAAERGLDPADYDAERIASELYRMRSGTEVTASERALFDLAVTIGVLREIEAVRIGRVDPRTLDWGYDVEQKKLDRPVVLRAARDGEGIPSALDGLEPTFPHYRRNKQMLAHYRALAAAGEPDAVPELTGGRRKVAPEDTWEGVPQLAARLKVFGDLPADAAAPSVAPDGKPLYDGALVDAVRSFQDRHVLDADGVIGKGTVDALNVPIAHRVRQLELAMERGRWLPDLSSRPTIFVNVPLFRLWATDPGTGGEPLRMKVVVGKSLEHRTPIFFAEMAYIVFRPYWSPPYGIAVKELVPHARRDPTYMEREDLEIVASGADDAPALPATPENLDAVVAGRLYMRQKPGPKNSLGLAKFIFPNVESIYMHGTPATQLFSRTRRDFSHGCIRLENPAALAAWVLRDDPAWTTEAIASAMNGARPKRVNLKSPLMVVLYYDTVHVNSEGVVRFASDIYHHDAELDRTLKAGYPYRETQ